MPGGKPGTAGMCHTHRQTAREPVNLACQQCCTEHELRCTQKPPVHGSRGRYEIDPSPPGQTVQADLEDSKEQTRLLPTATHALLQPDIISNPGPVGQSLSSSSLDEHMLSHPFPLATSQLLWRSSEMLPVLCPLRCRPSQSLLPHPATAQTWPPHSHRFLSSSRLQWDELKHLSLSAALCQSQRSQGSLGSSLKKPRAGPTAPPRAGCTPRPSGRRHPGPPSAGLPTWAGREPVPHRRPRAA